MRRGKQAFLLLAGSIAAAVWMAAAPVKSGIHVEMAVIQAGELVQTVWLNGTVGYTDEQPYVSLKTGKISKVYAKPGDTVREGDLLFQMDTTSEAQALSELYEARFQNKQAMSSLNEAASALSRQAELEWQQLEAQCKASIDAAQIRAATKGVVDTVCIKEGEWVNEGMLLGVSRGEEKQVAACVQNMDAALIETDAAAWIHNGNEKIPASVSQLQPSSVGDGWTVCILPENQDALASFAIGEFIQTEVVTGRKQSQALMPLAAADENGDVWIVEDGKVRKKAFAWEQCSRTHAQAAQEWAGQTVLLYPERYELKEGMPVQVAE